MKNIILMLSVLTVFFLVEYEKYVWDPCRGDTCLAILCPPEGCTTPAKQFFVKTLGEVRDIVDRNGTEHLLGMYRIEYNRDTKQANVRELKLVPSYVIE